MECKKYNTFVVINKPKAKQINKTKTMTKLEARGLSLENKKKLDCLC